MPDNPHETTMEIKMEMEMEEGHILLLVLPDVVLAVAHKPVIPSHCSHLHIVHIPNCNSRLKLISYFVLQWIYIYTCREMKSSCERLKLTKKEEADHDIHLKYSNNLHFVPSLL